MPMWRERIEGGLFGLLVGDALALLRGLMEHHRQLTDEQQTAG